MKVSSQKNRSRSTRGLMESATLPNRRRAPAAQPHPGHRRRQVTVSSARECHSRSISRDAIGAEQLRGG